MVIGAYSRSRPLSLKFTRSRFKSSRQRMSSLTGPEVFSPFMLNSAALILRLRVVSPPLVLTPGSDELLKFLSSEPGTLAGCKNN